MTSEQADFCYKCTEFYDASDERTIAWNDPAVGIEWPTLHTRILSAKDQRGTPLVDAEVYS